MVWTNLAEWNFSRGFQWCIFWIRLWGEKTKNKTLRVYNLINRFIWKTAFIDVKPITGNLFQIRSDWSQFGPLVIYWWHSDIILLISLCADISNPQRHCVLGLPVCLYYCDCRNNLKEFPFLKLEKRLWDSRINWLGFGRSKVKVSVTSRNNFGHNAGIHTLLMTTFLTNVCRNKTMKLRHFLLFKISVTS